MKTLTPSVNVRVSPRSVRSAPMQVNGPSRVVSAGATTYRPSDSDQ